MTYESFTSGGMRLGSTGDDPGFDLVPNPGGASLMPGEIVRRNYRDEGVRSQYSPGLLLEVHEGLGRVRWQQGLSEEWVALQWLIKE